MNFEPAGPLRTSTNLGDPARRRGPDERSVPAASRRSPIWSRSSIEAAEIVPRDRLAAARGRAGAGSLAAGAPGRGLAQIDGIARVAGAPLRASVHRPGEERVSPNAAELVPLRTLQRVVAIPIVARRRAAAHRDRRSRQHPRHRRASAGDAVPRSTSASRAATRSWPSSSGAPARSEVHGDAVGARRLRGRRRERGRSRGRGRRLRCAARPARQLRDHAGRHRRRERHPLRAAGGCAARASRASTACSTRCSGFRSGWRTASRPVSRCSRSSTSPSGASRRTAGSRSTRAQSGGCSTSASPCCRRSRASRS